MELKYTDNVRFNVNLSIIIFIISLIVLKMDAFFFTFIYIFASAFIQPDLDLVTTRAGANSFPIGNKIKGTKFGKILSQILYPINRLWFFFWTPYAYLLTHRGISHIPIIGTFSRVLYIDLFILIINYTTNYKIPYLYEFFMNINYYWYVFALPIFLSDTIHFIVDLMDSIRNGTRFSSYAHSPGLLIQIFNPRINKYHNKALKKAKRNSKKRKKKN